MNAHLINNRDNPCPSGARISNLNGETRNGKSVWFRNRAEVAEALHVAKFAPAAQEMGRPYLCFILGRQKLLEHFKAWPVQADGVDTHHLDALVQKILNRAWHEPYVFVDIIICTQQLIAAGIKENNIHWFERIADRG